MSDRDRQLSDEEVHDRLQHASAALGDGDAVTVRGKTALATARRALNILQLGLVAAMEKDSDQVEGLLPDEPSTRD